MEDIYDKRNGAVDAPHRHNYYTVLLVKHASGIHKIDFNSYPLGKHQIFFVAPLQMHQVLEEKASIGYAMTFSSQFLIENSIQLSFIESMNLFHDYGQSPPLELNDATFEKLTKYSEEIITHFNGDSPYKFQAIGAFLKLLLIECNHVCSSTPTLIDPADDISENRIIRTFKTHVDLHYKSEHSTRFYAELQHITPDYLNRIIKQTIGRTAKEYIQSRIITEAKRLLYFSNASNKEIGFELGFSEPANFSAFFKKCTGISPSKFIQ